MGDDTPDAYFSKIDSIITLLTDLGSTMDDDDIVTYAINGLSEKYGSLAQIIVYKDPFPDLATVRPMVTRFRVGTNRPTQCFNLHVSTISPIPKSYPIAFHDPNWYRAMLDEYTALIKNNTWILVPRPPDANIISLLFKLEYATEVLDRAGMLNCKPCRTPVDTDSKLSADGAPISDSTLYRSLAGALQYLTFTRPDISYDVQQWLTQMRIGRVVPLLVDQPLVIVFFLATIFSPGHQSANLLSLDLVLRLSIGCCNAVAETAGYVSLLELHTHQATATACLIVTDKIRLHTSEAGRNEFLELESLMSNLHISSVSFKFFKSLYGKRESEFHMTPTVELVRIQNQIKVNSEIASEMYRSMDDCIEDRKTVQENLDNLG
ncbi:ribonuclease H-like domain-containing protein [Tanacetum coccineum]